VLVTDAKLPIDAVIPLYRDRADCEHGFDELENQRGMSGFTTDISRCQALDALISRCSRFRQARQYSKQGGQAYGL